MRNIISMLVALLIGGPCLGQTVGELQKKCGLSLQEAGI